MSAIICFDPGKSTGYCVLGNIVYKARSYDILAQGVVGWEARAKRLRELVSTAQALDVDAILIENFKLYPSKAKELAYSSFEPIKVIERITVYCEEIGLDNRIVMQMANLRLNARIPVEHAKILKSVHSRAAYLHGRYFILTHRLGVGSS